MALTAEERRARLRQRTSESAADRGKTGLGKGLKVPFDLSKAGKDVVWYELKGNPRELDMIDIVPFEVTRPEYGNLRQFNGKPNGRLVGDWDYKLEIPVHRNVGVTQQAVLCLREAFGHKCAICDDMFDEYKKRGTPEFNEKTAKALQPKWRTIYCVYDYRDDKHVGLKLWDYAYKSGEVILMEKAENDPSGLVVFSDIQDGKIIEIESFVDKDFNDFVKVRTMRFLPRQDPYTEADVANNFPLDQMLIIPTVEEVTRLHLQMDSEPQQEPERQQEQPSRRRQTASQTTVNLCIAGGVLGKDQYQFAQCNDACPDDAFSRCSEEAKKLEGKVLEPGVDPASMNTPEQSPEPQRQTQRRRPVETPTPAVGTPPAASDAPQRRRR